MVAAGLRMLRGIDEAGGVCDLPGGGVAWGGCLPRAVATGLLVGFLTGLLGVGGGFLLVPALVVALGLRTPSAVTTSLVVIVVNSVAALLPYLTAGSAAGSAGGLEWGSIGVFAAAPTLASLPAGASPAGCRRGR